MDLRLGAKDLRTPDVDDRPSRLGESVTLFLVFDVVIQDLDCTVVGVVDVSEACRHFSADDFIVFLVRPGVFGVFPALQTD